MGFIHINVDSLFDNSVTDFNLYIPDRDGPILYSTDGYLWNKDELERLLAHGCNSLFTESTNIHKWELYQRVNTIPNLNVEQSPTARVASLECIGAAFVKCLNEGEVSDACIQKAQVIAENLTDCILEEVGCIRGLSQLCEKDEYVFHHSIRVSTYATAVAIELGISDRTSLCEIALGGIFHDLGKSKVPGHILNKQGVLTDEEWEHMRRHPSAGLEMVSDTSLSHVCREIIVHHHEKSDGTGYPDGISQNQILPEVQIATLADIFDALTSARPYQNPRSTFEALDLIRKKMHHHINGDIFRALIHCLKPTSKSK